MIEIKFTECKDIIPPEEFGGGFTHYMLRLLRKKNGGWLYGNLMPRGEIGVPPTATSFGTSVSECVRAAMTEDGKCSVFRLDDYLTRLDVQAKRMGLPSIDIELTSYGLRQLLSLSRRYLLGGEVFIHLTLLSLETDITVYPAQEAVLTVTLEKKQKTDMRAISVASSCDCPLSSPNRYAKTADFAVREGLYEAKKRGFDNVMWLDCTYRRYIECLAGMDLFFRIGDGVYHAGDGFFADSARRLMEGWGITLHSGRVSTDFLLKEYEAGNFSEVFAVGTSNGIQPVTKMDIDGKVLEFTRTKLAKKLYDTVNGIIYCDHPDNYKWITKV